MSAAWGLIAPAPSGALVPWVLNRRHPLAYLIRFFLVFNGPMSIDLVSGKLATAPSGSVPPYTFLGGGRMADLASGSGEYDYGDSDLYDITGELTLVWRGIVDSTAPSWTFVTKNGADSFTDCPFLMQFRTPDLFCRRSASGGSYADYRKGGVLTTGLHTVGFQSTGYNNDGEFFVDGATTGAASWGGSGGSGAAVANNATLRAGTGTNKVSYIIGWARKLSAVEHLRIHALLELLKPFNDEDDIWKAVSGLSLAASGFANTNAFGAPTIAPGAVTLAPSAYADGDSFGVPTVTPGPVTLSPAGLDDADALGAPVVSAGGATLAPPGLDDGDAFGAPTIAPGAVALAATAHDDADAFGAPTVTPGAVVLAPSGFADSDAFGAPGVAPGVATLAPPGPDDGDAFGAPVVSGGLVTLAPPGLADGDAFGAPAVAPGAVMLAPAGYAHAGAFGSPTIALLYQLLTPAGLANTSVFGAPYVQLVDTDGLSIRALRSVLAEETDEVWLLLLTIDHESLAEPVRVAQNHQNVTSRGSLFVGYPFDLDLPGDAPGEQAHVTLRIDNIGVPDEDDPDKKRVSDYLRAIDSPFTATIEVVLASQPDIVEAGPFELECRQADYDAAEVSAELGFENLLDEPYPADSFVPATHPGLF